MERPGAIQRLEEKTDPWDVIVIGGGASGLGAALEATTRGYSTLLLEQDDFARATSSRSTKLVHGGVRYLAQGNVSLVMQALRERGRLKRNAPHLVTDQSFVIPCYTWWCIPFYTIGLTLYDLLAGKMRIGRSIPLSLKQTIRSLPAINTKNLRGGVRYYDCQFDDARLAVNLCQTLFEHGGLGLNYMKVVDLIMEEGKVTGVKAEDMESGLAYNLRSKVVINATGVFVDHILKMENPDARDIIKPSQGIHLVLDRHFFQGEEALMIPKTSDGRVLFMVPWHNHVIAGTTDVPKQRVELEPQAEETEVEFILQTARRFMKEPPEREDILSIFTGLRPLAAPTREGKKTKEISRGHKIMITEAGLITLTGGKWTTYRKMGGDVIKRAIKHANLKKTKSVTRSLKIHGHHTRMDMKAPHFWYGADLKQINRLIEKDPGMGEVISEKLHILKAQVIWAVREEMARTLDDCLSRRTRTLQLDVKESLRIAPRVAEIMAREMGYNQNWETKQVRAYTALAKNYLPKPLTH